MTPKDFGRVAASTAKQVLTQKIREAEREEGFDHRHICKCCKGKQKFHKEYKWMYYEDYIKQGEMNDENI